MWTNNANSPQTLDGIQLSSTAAALVRDLKPMGRQRLLYLTAALRHERPELSEQDATRIIARDYPDAYAVYARDVDARGAGAVQAPRREADRDTTDVVDAVMREVRALRADDPTLSVDAAIARVLTANPDLYRAYQASTEISRV